MKKIAPAPKGLLSGRAKETFRGSVERKGRGTIGGHSPPREPECRRKRKKVKKGVKK